MRKCCDVIAIQTKAIATYIQNMHSDMTDRFEQMNDFAYSHDMIFKGLTEIEKGCLHFHKDPRPDLCFFKPVTRENLKK